MPDHGHDCSSRAHRQDGPGWPDPPKRATRGCTGRRRHRFENPRTHPRRARRIGLGPREAATEVAQAPQRAQSLCALQARGELRREIFTRGDCLRSEVRVNGAVEVNESHFIASFTAAGDSLIALSKICRVVM